LLLFTKQCLVNDASIAGIREELFVPVSKNDTSSKFDFFIYGSHF